MIVLVEGVPGSGKTYSTCRRIVSSLEAGKYVATNVQLHEGWEQIGASANGLRRLPGLKHLATDAAAKFTDRLVMSGSLEELFNVRLKPCGECSACGKGHTCMKEGRGVMILDEAHNWLNARSWNAADREKIVKWFTQHRKLGWDVYLISQRVENIDAQVRALAEYRVYLRNLRKMRWHGIPLFPFNVFVAIWTWESIKDHVLKRESYLLNRICRIYDSMALSHGLEHATDEPVWLPRSYLPAQAEEPPDADAQATPLSTSSTAGTDAGEAGAGPPARIARGASPARRRLSVPGPVAVLGALRSPIRLAALLFGLLVVVELLGILPAGSR